MARARNIKPGFFTNDALVELPFETRLLFIGLWTIADREGRLNDRPKKIKMELFPADSVDVEDMLNQLENAGFIFRYGSAEGIHIQIVNWHKHQNPHAKESASTIPAPEIPVQAPEIPARARLIPDSLNRIPDSRESHARDPLPEAEMPPGLDLTAWAQWVEYRKQVRKPLKPASIPAAQQALAAFGSDQIAVVTQSIANGWQGLFALKNGGKHETHQPIDNSAPARVKRANERRERERIAGYAERVD